MYKAKDSEADKAATAEKASPKALKTASALLNIAFAACVLLVLFLAVSGRDGDGISIGPYRLANILTGSMEPAIGTGSLVIIKNVPEDQLTAGDIITFKPSDGSRTLLTHRIIGRGNEDNSFITQGDASGTPDFDPVYYESIAGKVVLTVPLLGHLAGFLRTPRGIAALILFVILYEIIRRLVSSKIYTVKEKKQ